MSLATRREAVKAAECFAKDWFREDHPRELSCSPRVFVLALAEVFESYRHTGQYLATFHQPKRGGKRK